MKNIFVSLLIALSLSGCAANLARNVSSADNAKVLDEVATFQNGDILGVGAAYYQEMKRREHLGIMNAEDDAQYLSQRRSLDAQEEQDKAIREASEPSLGDYIMADAACQDAPIECRRHIADSSLSKVGL
ncbi:hypothetical protein VBJ04_10995 [Enterobacter hormaechei]|nr:hypothetical protein [Enterobacter hormaechei]EKV4773210.1 hypothetical protein [Enterobacter hormaechei]ELJ9633280.1 hypothetical protein [Enterobacter hormaechei]ELJ9636368.1 hypothetical protein [Enterobacter hormaechei]ELW9319246.1 hypothetical protein [Enterobacter hormaechei]ELW9322331.1 hypothetical protein [Enterobacter hormaechei]